MNKNFGGCKAEGIMVDNLATYRKLSTKRRQSWSKRGQTGMRKTLKRDDLWHAILETLRN